MYEWFGDPIWTLTVCSETQTMIYIKHVCWKRMYYTHTHFSRLSPVSETALCLDAASVKISPKKPPETLEHLLACLHLRPNIYSHYYAQSVTQEHHIFCLRESTPPLSNDWVMSFQHFGFSAERACHPFISVFFLPTSHHSYFVPSGLLSSWPDMSDEKVYITAAFDSHVCHLWERAHKLHTIYYTYPSQTLCQSYSKRANPIFF